MRPARALELSCLLLAAFAVGGCVSTQDIEGIQTQISDVQRQLVQMQQLAPSKTDVGNLETSLSKQMDSLLKTEADMQVKLQDVTGQIEALQAKLEDTTYRLSQLSQQIAATNQELKSFRVPAPGPSDPADPNFGVPPPVAAPPPGAGADPKALYDAAYNDYLKGSYDLSTREFQEYLQNFPDTDLADNATYWIGECWYRQKKFRQAVEQYDQLLSRYPKSDKAAGATLKKGYSFIELGEKTKGLLQLQRVVRDFPASDEANLARQRLREIGG